MTLINHEQAANTREKLSRLEARYKALRTDTAADARLRELNMRSLKRLINQFKEKIAIFEAHQPAR